MVRRAAFFFALAAYAVAAVPSHAQAGLHLAAVRQRLAMARGIEPADERSVTTFTDQALSGTEIELRSGDDYRIDRTLTLC
jgi:hypothetical protein